MEGRFETQISILKGKPTEILMVRVEGRMPDELITIGKLWGIIE